MHQPNFEKYRSKAKHNAKPSFNTATKSTFNGWNMHQTPKLDASMSQAANSINESMRAAFLPVYFTKTTTIREKISDEKLSPLRSKQTMSKISPPDSNS